MSIDNEAGYPGGIPPSTAAAKRRGLRARRAKDLQSNFGVFRRDTAEYRSREAARARGRLRPKIYNTGVAKRRLRVPIPTRLRKNIEHSLKKIKYRRG